MPISQMKIKGAGIGAQAFRINEFVKLLGNGASDEPSQMLMLECKKSIYKN